MIQLAVYGNTPAIKNSKRLFCPRGCPGNISTNFKSKRPNLVHSKQFDIWYKANIKTIPHIFNVKRIARGLVIPVVILAYFYRETKRKFDYSNALDAIQDLIVAVGILRDDNANVVRTIPAGHEKDNVNPRCELYIFSAGEDYHEKLKELEEK
ncbi:MAG: hypothetical protein GTO45_22285 [Candidatus Aminicenantes bacterium]|nr:hypothetical protein [Candidatus Aminicenantes bacterium]NIM84084.1 hypothetical protein [Candidatus Aminicenantes bacterium]NIN20864.1 hypothetical protein [Candidatus Aminicenantes bacterium]NIN44685.1 hypothetical protein [Candidatus Aminicenantes bacterium]NIN87493.1 hypothetical protein [Candidatus Aminicenantes bacterium]